jgi:hypothetical protein
MQRGFTHILCLQGHDARLMPLMPSVMIIKSVATAAVKAHMTLIRIGAISSR